MWTIRRATLEDIDALTELRQRFLEEIGYAAEAVPGAVRCYLADAVPTAEVVAWLAEEDGQIVATSGVVFLQKPPHGRNLSGKGGFGLKMYTLFSGRHRCG